MNLEHELRALPIAFPDEPDLAPRVLARLERPARRWWLVPALAALAVAGALFAIPQTRAAILDLFRIGGVEVRRVETQPRAPVRAGRARPRGLARDRAAHGRLPAARAARSASPHTSTGRWSTCAGSGTCSRSGAASSSRSPRSSSARARRPSASRFAAATGLWITGARHEIIYRDPATDQIVAKSRRLAGNVLIWEAGDVTYRLEGAKTVADARAVARNLKAP